MNRPRNPDDINTEMHQVRRQIHECIHESSQRKQAADRAHREFDHAWHQAYLDAPGPAHSKKSHAVVATKHMREQAEEAQQLYEYTRGMARALEHDLSALQTESSSVRAMYVSETGVGR